MNNKIIKVKIEIVIVKELDNTIFSSLNVNFVIKTLFLTILPFRLTFSNTGFILYSGLSKKTCFMMFK
jgi:hypothetical protein